MFINDIACAIQGKFLWRKLRKKCDTNYYIFIPEYEENYLPFSLFYIDEYIENLKRKRVRERLGWYKIHPETTYIREMEKENISITIIVSDIFLIEAISFFAHFSYKLKVVTPYQMKCFMKFYALVDMSSQWKSFSIDIPYKTYGERMLGRLGTTYEDIACYDILELDQVPKKRCQDYNGQNIIILNLLKIIRKGN